MAKKRSTRRKPATDRKRPRHANGEGSISRRGKGWRARLFVDGKRVEMYARTREEANERLFEAKRKRADGVPVILKTESVEKFMAQWLEAKQPAWKPSAYKFNEKYTRVHIVPELGRTQLLKLSAAQLQVLYAKKLKTHSPMTVRHIHRVLHAALASAVRWQVLTRNPADFVDPPRVEPRQPTVLDRDQMRALFAEVAGDELEPLYVLALTTGLRQGELLALTWRDVNLKDGYLDVNGTLQPDGTISSPKTKLSRRRIDLGDVALAALQLMPRNSVRLFPYPAIRVSRHYRALALRLRFPSTRFHDLRHSFASYLATENTHPKLVQTSLGHSRIQTTLDVYSHFFPSAQREVANRMDKLLKDEAS